MNDADQETKASALQPSGQDRSSWGRVSVVSTVLTATFYLVVTFLYVQSGHPTGSGYYALVSSIFWAWAVVFVIVGRRYKLRGRGNWIRAAVLPIAMIFIFGGLAFFSLAMAGYY